MRKNTEHADPAYLDLRTRLISRGYSIRSFALAHGYAVQTTYCAAKGCRAGIQSVKIANHLKRIAYAPAQPILAGRH